MSGTRGHDASGPTQAMAVGGDIHPRAHGGVHGADSRWTGRGGVAMTLRGPHLQPVNAHTNALLAALRRAGEDGLTEGECAVWGGRWWRNRISELCRAGYGVGEERGVLYLVGVGRAASQPVDGGRSETPASGPSSPDRLFELTTPHYLDREAA
jgi:hypothetical protein